MRTWDSCGWESETDQRQGSFLVQLIISYSSTLKMSYNCSMRLQIFGGRFETLSALHFILKSYTQLTPQNTSQCFSDMNYKKFDSFQLSSLNMGQIYQVYQEISITSSKATTFLLFHCFLSSFLFFYTVFSLDICLLPQSQHSVKGCRLEVLLN